MAGTLSAGARAPALVLALAGVSGCAPAKTIDAREAALASYHERAFTPAARTPAASPRVRARLSADEAVATAKKNSARLAELHARVATAHEGIAAATQRENPTLQATKVRFDRLLAGEPRVSPSLRFRPERPGEIDAREAAAKALEQAAQAELALEEIALEAEVRWLYDDVVLCDVEAATIERMAAARRKLADEMKARTTTSTATAVEADLTELSAIEAEGAARDRRAARALALAALLDRMGVDPSSDVEVIAPPDVSAQKWPPDPLPSERVLVERAIARDGRIRAAGAGIDAADARLRQEELRRVPWPTFVDVGYAFTPGSEPGLGWFIGAGVELPVFQMNGAAIRTAEAAKDASRRNLDTQVETIARDVRARVREVNAAAALVTRLREEATPVLERADKDAARALEVAGIDGVRAALTAERAAMLEVRVLAGMRRYRTAMSDLRRAVAGSPD